MIAALALVAAVVTAPDLSAAQAAFAQGDYERADTLATAAAQPPNEGAALYLAGLARFRAGRAQEALDALDRAEHAPDRPAPGLFHYNRAACLYELGRFADAEADYLKAAEIDPSIATLSLVNASYAALDGGSPERAREIAARARAAATPGEADVIADLETHIAGNGSERATAEYREGLADYDGGRYAEAREHFHRATELDAADGRSLIMSGASSYRLGERGRARADLNEALRRRLDDEDARTARDYLDALRGGLPSRKVWEGAVRLAAGFDNDPLQTGFFQSNEIPRFSTVENASGVATADVVVAVRPRLGHGVGTELAYTFNQIAYLTDPASDLSLQQHELSTALEWALRDDLRVGVAGLGQMTFTGVSRFRGLQNAIGASTWGSFDEGDWTSTRIDLGLTGKQGVGAEFAYLTGSRADVAATQQLHIRSFSMDLGYRFRAEMIGTSVQTVPFGGTQLVDPFAYLGHAFWASTRFTGAYGTFEVNGGYEARDYLDDSFSVSGADERVSNRRRRHDDRLFGGFAASTQLTRNLMLSLRYDILVNRSNSAGSNSGRGRSSDSDARSYDRHVMLLGTTVTW
ncbi:MAG: tetratricopeptide repeat protein [Myxococcales bacterium]